VQLAIREVGSDIPHLQRDVADQKEYLQQLHEMQVSCLSRLTALEDRLDSAPHAVPHSKMPTRSLDEEDQASQIEHLQHCILEEGRARCQLGQFFTESRNADLEQLCSLAAQARATQQEDALRLTEMCNACETQLKQLATDFCAASWKHKAEMVRISSVQVSDTQRVDLAETHMAKDIEERTKADQSLSKDLCEQVSGHRVELDSFVEKLDSIAPHLNVLEASEPASAREIAVPRGIGLDVESRHRCVDDQMVPCGGRDENMFPLETSTDYEHYLPQIVQVTSI